MQNRKAACNESPSGSSWGLEFILLKSGLGSPDSGNSRLAWERQHRKGLGVPRARVPRRKLPAGPERAEPRPHVHRARRPRSRFACNLHAGSVCLLLAPCGGGELSIRKVSNHVGKVCQLFLSFFCFFSSKPFQPLSFPLGWPVSISYPPRSSSCKHHVLGSQGTHQYVVFAE